MKYEYIIHSNGDSSTNCGIFTNKNTALHLLKELEIQINEQYMKTNKITLHIDRLYKKHHIISYSYYYEPQHMYFDDFSCDQIPVNDIKDTRGMIRNIL